MPAPAYPESQSVDVALKDGSSVHIRPIRPGDREAVSNFLRSLSEEAMTYRFFGIPNLQWATNWSLDVDYADRYGLVATLGADHAIVAHAAYVRTGSDRAEVAFVVGDRIQGHGIATIMLGHLAAVAERHGIAVFIASVMPSNHKMVGVFRDSGFPVTLRTRAGVVEVELPTSLSEEAVEAFELREQLAAIGAVRSFVAPKAVAVIGASSRDGTVGAELFRNLVQGGFAAGLYPVNPRATEIVGRTAYPSIGDVPERIELAVIVVPAVGVAGVARQCAEAGVRALLVISSGFTETGPEGAARQRELLEICRESGMRLIGPNCLGVINTDPQVRLDATFAASPPPPGRVGFLSQSGGLGIALMEAAGRLSLGLSTFVSVGNKADISGNDLLEYWEQDAATDVILLYLESFGNPRRFARIARRVSAQKPILAVKSGRSPAGARATSSHTGALVSASDVNVDALFRQAGVIRADTIGELLNTAALLSAQPAPRAKRVAIVTNGGGPGILCADECEADGLEVVELSAQTGARLAEFLPAGASVRNPIDMIATASAADYRRTVEALVRSGECDAVITIFVPPLVTEPEEVAREIDLAVQDAHGVTVASVFMEREQPPRDFGHPVTAARFEFPEDAVRALAHAANWAAWRGRPQGVIPPADGYRPDEAAAIIAGSLAAGEGWLSPADVARLLGCYGIPLAPTRVVRDVQGAVAAAGDLGYPVVLKAVAPGLLHKTDAGGVRIGLAGEDQVRAAAREIGAAVARAGHPLERFIVQPMVPGGVELLLGVVHDASFGPVLVCGAGGTSAELLRDVAIRITPLTDLDAGEMIRSLRTFPLLDGYRGAPPCDVGAVEHVLLALSALVEAHPEVAELDANPLIASPSGALIVDARVRVQQAAPPRPLGSLRS
jgi:acetyl coenzyme A synthetase (ADP forming)-like protein